MRAKHGLRQYVLGGFSQGAMLALDVLFNSDSEPPALLAVLSGAPMCIDMWKQALASKSLEQRRQIKRVPILQSHGNRDWVLPVFVGRWLDRYLKRNGFWTKYLEFDGDHELNEQAIDSLHALCFQLAVEGTLRLGSAADPSSNAVPVASPMHKIAGFSRPTEQQPLMDTFDDLLYKAGYAVASCVLPVAKLARR
eukprot:Protomagalhaensia_wolfi_Nauph_80__2402@NODE_2584_length_1047_cov_3_679563_g2023_i0_p1_GENE_NODE_2584_length_1047_cov_3_679563_g2023_i0NODE_2584_length_1047_cov_3_679563_g2023_i0_p1_ORF_typecomplete_len195_score27_09Abhydrolase_2/PF02230_16/8_4e19FSH1/PF03959_13/2_4e05Hydrolase_4/PF12146_8/0_00018Abhydrolase_1/PF00561_20/0_0097Peptidase_S9/PF00326_21/0_0019Peptidase_S9/PF00326_21/9_2e03Thioesterase/PF00975_20/0_0078Cutinase/PF01083_22/0_01Abhydrolase_3/PF07859_13/0_02Abhydrolase_3/PF07859_13/3_6e